MKIKKPNIILITTDQHRYDSLGVNGNSILRTPNIDSLARDGVNFRQAYVQNTVCVPSRACIQTGRYTHQHGVTYMESIIDNTPGLPHWEKTFMEYLQDAGYCTGAAGKIHMYPEKGFHRMKLTGGKGSRWVYSSGQEIGPAPLGPEYAAWLEKKRPGAYEEIYEARRKQPDYKSAHIFENTVSAEEYVENWIGEEALGFITGNTGQQPFFLWCGFCGPHDPWDPPVPYNTMYNPADVSLPEEIPGWPSWKNLWDEKTVRKIRAYYYGMITCIDDQIGRLVSILKSRDLYNDTILILSSDHGEFLCERGRTGKALFYDSILHVPLIIKPPKGDLINTPVFDGLVENFSIAPTILDYAGLDIPGTMCASSLRPYIEGTGINKEAIFSEYIGNDRLEMSKCIRTRDFKYILHIHSGREELYNLQEDPREKVNLLTDNPEHPEKILLQKKLLTWMCTTEWRNSRDQSAR
ncbi:MAG: hypothetical protein A2096_16840 [Spirochaetes bacterium GWF1_41_5]|nr:MAG: hypothetical protein A2096_16840 [Spirochaetes bacterium GWF1_41_5]